MNRANVRLGCLLGNILLSSAISPLVCPTQTRMDTAEQLERKFRINHQSRYPEISGLAISRQLWRGQMVGWVISDESDREELGLFALGTGRLLQSYRFEGIDGVPYNNLEDITIGPCEPDETFDYQCLYLADTGDNLARDTSGTKGLKDLHIYKVREPQISDQGLDAYNDITISETDVTVYEVSMKDTPNAPTRYADFEAIWVDPTGDSKGGQKGDIFLISRWSKAEAKLTRVFVFPASHQRAVQLTGKKGTLYVLPGITEGRWNELATMSVEGFTRADMTADGSLLALGTDQYVHFFVRGPGQSMVDAFSSNSCEVAFRNDKAQRELQFEALAFSPFLEAIDWNPYNFYLGVDQAKDGGLSQFPGAEWYRYVNLISIAECSNKDCDEGSTTVLPLFRFEVPEPFSASNLAPRRIALDSSSSESYKLSSLDAETRSTAPTPTPTQAPTVVKVQLIDVNEDVHFILRPDQSLDSDQLLCLTAAPADDSEFYLTSFLSSCSRADDSMQKLRIVCLTQLGSQEFPPGGNLLAFQIQIESGGKAWCLTPQGILVVCEDVAAAKRSSASSLFAPRALFKLGVDRSSKLMVAGVAEELNEDEDERSFLVTNDPAGGEGKLAKCLQLGGKRVEADANVEELQLQDAKCERHPDETQESSTKTSKKKKKKTKKKKKKKSKKKKGVGARLLLRTILQNAMTAEGTTVTLDQTLQHERQRWIVEEF